MRRWLDVLGPLKWPTLVAVLVLPGWFYFDGWRSGWNGEPLAVYSAEAILGLPLVPLHAASADPLADATTAWQVRLCADCPARVRALRLAQGDCVNSPRRWTPAQGQDGRLVARVDRTDSAERTPSAEDGSVCLWIALDAMDGRSGVHRWTLREATPPSEFKPPRSS